MAADATAIMESILFIFGLLFVALLIKGKVSRSCQDRYRISGNQQPSQRLPTANGSRPELPTEQERQDRRFVILTSILHKKVIANPNHDELSLPHEMALSNRSLDSDGDVEAQEVKQKDDIYVDRLASWRSNRLLVSEEIAEEHEAHYSPKTCAICLDSYKLNDNICWSNNEACYHAYHLDCMVGWLMEHDDCPLCRENYLGESAAGQPAIHIPTTSEVAS